MTNERSERDHVTHAVTTIFIERDLGGKTSEILLAIADLTELVIRERAVAGVDASAAASDRVHEAWVAAVRDAATAGKISEDAADMITRKVIG